MTIYQRASRRLDETKLNRAEIELRARSTIIYQYQHFLSFTENGKKMKGCVIILNLRYFCLFFAKWRNSYIQDSFLNRFVSIQIKLKSRNSLENGQSEFKSTMCQLCKKICVIATLSTGRGRYNLRQPGRRLNPNRDI